MKMLFKSLLFLLNLSFSYASWYEQKEQGWFWYKKAPLPNIFEEKTESISQIPKNSKTYAQKLKALQKEVTESQAKAVLEPTLENIHQFQRLQERLITQASRFEEMWMVASLLSPKGYRYSDQPSPPHRQIFEQRKKNHLEQRLKELSRTHGLFFAFKRSCPYCHQFAPLVRHFAQTYGFEVKAISADEGELPEFPEAVLDNGILALINPKGIYPALFMVEPERQQVTPVAWGMMSSSQLLDNMSRFLEAREKNLV